MLRRNGALDSLALNGAQAFASRFFSSDVATATFHAQRLVQRRRTRSGFLRDNAEGIRKKPRSVRSPLELLVTFFLRNLCFLCFFQWIN